MASTAPTTLEALPLFILARHDYHAELDAAPSTRITDLSLFKDEEIDALYKHLLAQIDLLGDVYARLLSHLSIASKISTETGALMRECFFLQHNLAGQFEMFGMYRCAHHSRRVESLLALFPPIQSNIPPRTIRRRRTTKGVLMDFSTSVTATHSDLSAAHEKGSPLILRLDNLPQLTRTPHSVLWGVVGDLWHIVAKLSQPTTK